MKQCHACGAVWEDEVKKQPGPKDICGGCSAYLHCCLNCLYYEPGVHNDCYIPTTEWVGDKAGCNFCDEFTFADAADAGTETRPGDSARNALDELFGGGDESNDSGSLDDFKRLFGD